MAFAIKSTGFPVCFAYILLSRALVEMILDRGVVVVPHIC